MQQSTPPRNGRMWVYNRDSTSMEVFDRTNNAVLKVFDAGGNYSLPCGGTLRFGGGVAHDPTDGNIWISILSNGGCSDGFIHKIPAMGGGDLAKIPDPTMNDQYGFTGKGIGAMDYDPEENVLYAISFGQRLDGTNSPWIYKLDASGGGILNKFPYGAVSEENRSLAIERPASLGGRKALRVNQVALLDINSGALISGPLWSGASMYGVDIDEVTGEGMSAIVAPWARADISGEDGKRCDCEVIARPAPQTVTGPGTDPNKQWSMQVEVSDNDGLVLRNVKLGQRYMAERISVPYFTLQTSLFAKQRGELKPDSSDSSARSRLISYYTFSDNEKLVVEATYLIDQIPATATSCLHITQRYEFYNEGFGCEPSATLPCSRWKPIVKYHFYGQGEIVNLNIAQRQHLSVDGIPDNTVGLFKDCDYPGLCHPTEGGIVGSLGFEKKFNPLYVEWSDRAVTGGQATNKWDNIHQTNLGIVEEPGLSPDTEPSLHFVGPGCPECVHSHWRWGAIQGEAFNNGKILEISPSSKQDFDFGVVRYRAGEEDPNDFKDLLQSPEFIRTTSIAGRNPLQVYRNFAPEDTVLWYSATGSQIVDSFFGFGSFFSSSNGSKLLYGGNNGLASQMRSGPATSSSPSSLTLEQDGLISILATNTYTDGPTTVAAFDASIVGPLPTGYTTYNNLSYHTETEAQISGPDTVTFSVASVTDQTVFNNLRIFHAEPDPFDPGAVIWADRTILSPDPQGPDFASKTISARVNLLGQFVVASLTGPPPSGAAAGLSITSSDSPNQVVAGSDLTYTLNITNSGPQPATGINLTDGLPPNTEFVSATASQGTCAEADGDVVCKLDALNAGASAAVTIIVKPTEGGEPIPTGGKVIINTANVRANESDADLTNNSATENTTLLPDPNLAPTVSITSPSTGNMFTGPASITVNASASDADGSISKVEFFDNGELAGTGTLTGTNQYSFSWNSVAFGKHSLIAVATDNLGKTNVSVAANIVVNGLANVSIINPTMKQVFQRPANVTISANASDSSGSISKVEFYANGTLIGTGVPAGQNQYNFAWNNAPGGNYLLTAVATDAAGVTTTSVPVNIVVNDLPLVSLTSPTQGAFYSSPSSSITLKANATDVDGSISKVEFYANGALIGTSAVVGAYQHSFIWNNAPGGNYTLTAIATDNNKATTTSSPINITVNTPPSVSLTGPASGTQYSAPASVTLTSAASDADGSISKVEFFANGSYVGAGAATGPGQYSFTWTAVGIGNYSLTAIATDNGGATTTSGSTDIKVTSPALLVAGSTTLNSSDSAIKARLEALNYIVTVKDGTATSADANGKAVVVISSTVTPTAVGTKFRDVTVPVVLWESGLFYNMGMTTKTSSNFGTTTGQTQVKITNAAHQMAAGLSGTVAVVTASGTFTWGKPNANASSVATLASDTSRIVVFGYNKSAAMPGLVAPARRVGLFMFDTTAATFNSNGGNLFDAAIKWATGRP
ncbi:MAG TPA: Ig-like domain-containing protein [Pyrinomonadaceae bacterium]|nr:Ig-like domain-containing protein [Pyrinomonadaceae bacterium]